MITSEPRLEKQNLQLERNGVLFFQHMLEGAQKGLDTADIVGDPIFRQLRTKIFIARQRVAPRVDADTTLRKSLPVPAVQHAYRAAL